MRVLLDRAPDFWPVAPAAYVTTAETSADELRATGMRVYVIREADRRTPVRAIQTAFQSLRVVLKERPDAIVTTGAMPMAIMCVWARFLRAKVVWVDCISQTETLSLSGRAVRRLSHLTLTQWPEIAMRTRGVEYAGEVL
jgi:UDP-N-acetylglucosamine:LPS N-acetylglucosamine transferase